LTSRTDPKPAVGNPTGGQDAVLGFGVHSVEPQVRESDTNRGTSMMSGSYIVDPEVPIATVLETARARPSTEPRALNVTSPLINEVIIPIGQKDKFGS